MSAAYELQQRGHPEPFYPSQLDSVDFIHGHTVRRPATGDADLSRYDLKLTDEEKHLGLAGLSAKHVKPVLDQLGDVRAPDWPPRALKRYDDLTWVALRRQRDTHPTW
jgi:hypothetical protein